MKLRFAMLAALAFAAPAFGQHSTIIPGMCVPEDHVINGHLNALRAQPETFLGQKVRFEARFHRLGEVYQPFYTVFDSFQHMNFSAWDLDTDIKTKAGYMNHCPLLYVTKSNIQTIEELARLEKEEAFLAVGVVRSTFDGQAFIEVTDIDRCWEAPKDPTCCDVHSKDDAANHTDHATTEAATPAVETKTVTVESETAATTTEPASTTTTEPATTATSTTTTDTPSTSSTNATPAATPAEPTSNSNPPASQG